jgi:hypothetical protein
LSPWDRCESIAQRRLSHRSWPLDLNTVDVTPLDDTLARLRQLHSRGGLPVLVAGAKDWYEVMLFPPANEAEIYRATSILAKTLPEEFLHFWRFSDGANLFVNESGLHGVGVASTELIGELQLEEAEFYGADVMARYVVFARVNGAGDFLVFDTMDGRVLDGVHAEQPHEWALVAPTFSEWLETFTEAGGRYYWIERLYDAGSS